MTTYDNIWETYLLNCKVDHYEHPTEEQAIYREIHNAVSLFNNRMRKSYRCDDPTETLDVELTNDELLILANYIKLVFVENKQLYSTTLLSPFTKDMGIKNHGQQMKTLENSVERQKAFIESLILNGQEDFL